MTDNGTDKRESPFICTYWMYVMYDWQHDMIGCSLKQAVLEVLLWGVQLAKHFDTI